MKIWTNGEKNVHAYFSYGLKNLKKRPKRSNLHVCTFSADMPRLIFLLKDQGGYCIMDLEIEVNRKLIVYNKIKYPFVIRDQSFRHFYMPASLPDEHLLNWMYEYGSRITVLKEHLPDFHYNFLQRLTLLHKVYYVPYRSKKRVSNSPDLVLICYVL